MVSSMGSVSTAQNTVWNSASCFAVLSRVLQSSAYLKFKRNPAEPCMFYKYVDGKMVLFILWVDNSCLVGDKAAVLQAMKDFASLWNCKSLGKLNEYI